MELPIKIKKLREDATLPTYAKKGDACLDVKAVKMCIRDSSYTHRSSSHCWICY